MLNIQVYMDHKTVVRYAVGLTDGFKVEVRLRQGSAIRSLFELVLDRLTDEARQKSTRTMTSADDTVICSESREQVAW